MERYDAIVLGAGVIGAAAALSLAPRGRTLVLERHAFLHDRGSSHGGSRIFRHAYGDAEHVRLAIAADAAWRALERASGERLLHRTGGLDLGAARGRELDAIEDALRASGRPVERIRGGDIRARFPAFAVGDDVEALFQPDAAIVPASRAVATMLRLATAAGAELRDREGAATVALSAYGAEVVTEAGRYAADRLVIAAGAWLGELLPDLALPLRFEQQQVLYLRVGADARAFAPPRMPVFVDRRGGLYGFPLFERPNAIKVADHDGAPSIDLARRSFDIDPAWAAATVAAARSLLPGLTTDVVEAQTCLYSKTPDERFVLDRHPDHPHVVVAGGGSGHAFKFGPVLGEIAADLVTSGTTVHEVGAFALDRFRRV